MITLLLPLLLPPVDDLSDRVDHALARWDRDDTLGGAVAVIRGEDVVLLKTFGAASLTPKRLVDASTTFYLASLAKPFTAACVLQAAKTGLVDLNAPLTRIFPELTDIYGSATLSQCMEHRAGIQDVYDLAIMADLGSAPIASNAAAIEHLSRVPELCTTAGDTFLYSNSGYVLLAEALKRGTDRSLADYAREHIFEPLGMTNATFDVTEPVPTGLNGPGGMSASIDDMIAFARFLNSGGWERSMDNEPKRPRHPNVGGYVDGWMHQVLSGHSVRRHFGGAFGFSSDLIHVPSLNLTVIVLSSAPDLTAFEMAPELLSWVVPSGEDPPKPDVAPGDPELVAGLWQTADSGRVVFALPSGPGVRLVGLGDIKVQLVHVGDGHWRGIDVQSPFEVAVSDGGLRLIEDGRETLFKRVAANDLPNVEEVAGDYVNPWLDTQITLAPGPRGSLSLEQHDALIELPPFVPMGNDIFLCDRGAVLILERDDNRAVTGLVAYTGRAWRIPFERADSSPSDR